MLNIPSDAYVVEFWPKPFADVLKDDQPQVTTCDSPASAIALEGRFHGIGWPARALTLTSRIDRFNLTSKPV